MSQAETSAARLSVASFTLAVITPDSGDIGALDQWLNDTVEQSGSLLHNAPIALDIKHLEPMPDAEQIAAIRMLLASHGMVLAGLTGPRSKELEALAEAAGINVISNQGGGRSKPEPRPSEADHAGVNTVFVDSAIRAGQQVFANEGDLVVQAAVNPGSEAVAKGSIHIYGKLMGRALAGATGNERSRIYCQSLEAELVSIAGQYRMIDQQNEPCWAQPAMIELADGQLQIVPLDASTRRS